MTDDPWAAVDAALPKGWTIGRPSFREDEHRWQVWAVGPRPIQRLRAPEQVGGEGTTEAEALKIRVDACPSARAIGTTP